MSKSVNKKRAWELKYEKFLNGEMDSKIQELETKVNEKKANREEYEELKNLQKLKNNISKVKNVLELREKLEGSKKEIKDEISRLTNLEKANKEQEKIEKELGNVDKERASILKQLKAKDLEEKEKTNLETKLKDLDQKLAENNKRYISNQNIFATNRECKNKKLMGMTKQELENKEFELSTKISKCNLVGRNLMQGKSWDAIEVDLDNWKDRRFTSKEKLTEKAKDTKKEEIDLEQISNNIIKTTEEQIKNEEKAKENEESSLAVKSKFFEKHPRLEKFVNGIKGIWGKVSRKEEPKAEGKKGINENKEVIKKDDDFKKYLKEVTEKGMEQVKKEKLEMAKKKAHERETEKFGKNYADMSYKVNDDKEIE